MEREFVVVEEIAGRVLRVRHERVNRLAGLERRIDVTQRGIRHTRRALDHLVEHLRRLHQGQNVRVAIE